MTATAPASKAAFNPLPDIEQRIRGPLIGAMRIVLGLLWLANIEWKRPPDFGKHLKNGLYKYVAAGPHSVFPPYGWVIKHVILKQYTLFGWITLILECTVAALLLLGLFTRGAALLGAAQATAVGLTVLNYPNEWPWSYYLMAAMHLLLFAVVSQQSWSVDGAIRTGSAAKLRAATAIGAVALVVGVAGLIAARSTGFSAHRGARLGWAEGELKWLWFNPLSAILTIILGLLVIAALRLGQSKFAWAAVAGFALMALQVLLQWRYNDGRWSGGFFGGTGSNLAFWGMCALGLSRLLPSPRAATNS